MQRGQRGGGRPAQLAVDPTHHPERVLVEPAPEMQPMLLDPVTALGIAPGRPLATQPPTGLVDGDVVALLPALPGRE
ncbi:MAG: hypothetical protein ACK559_09585, partial [bacterium]